VAIEIDKDAKKGRAKPAMNVTPLVDVVLVLLIIFMVITPMMAQQFWLNLPTQPEERAEPAPPPQDGEGPIVVSVDRQGVVRINREVVERDRLQTKLTRVLAARGERTIFFDAANDAPFGDAVAVLDLARGGGAATIAVLTEPIAQQ
jgi:biopolymer transport protein ExbD